MHKPNDGLIMIRRQIVEQGLNRQHKKNHSITIHKIGDTQDDQWRILATFDDSIQLTLKGKTVQVSSSLLIVVVSIAICFRSPYTS